MPRFSNICRQETNDKEVTRKAKRVQNALDTLRKHHNNKSTTSTNVATQYQPRTKITDRRPVQTPVQDPPPIEFQLPPQHPESNQAVISDVDASGTNSKRKSIDMEDNEEEEPEAKKIKLHSHEHSDETVLEAPKTTPDVLCDSSAQLTQMSPAEEVKAPQKPDLSELCKVENHVVDGKKGNATDQARGPIKNGNTSTSVAPFGGVPKRARDENDAVAAQEASWDSKRVKKNDGTHEPSAFERIRAEAAAKKALESSKDADGKASSAVGKPHDQVERSDIESSGTRQSTNSPKDSPNKSCSQDNLTTATTLEGASNLDLGDASSIAGIKGSGEQGISPEKIASAPRTAYPGLGGGQSLSHQNAVLQNLANIKPFTDHYKGMKGIQENTTSSEAARGAISGTEAVQNLPEEGEVREHEYKSKTLAKIGPRIAKLFRNMHIQTEAVHTTDVTSCLEDEDTCKGNKEHDPAHFMGRLLAKLEKEEMEHSSMDTKISELFKGKQEHSIQCTNPRCKRISAQSQTLSALTLYPPTDKQSTTIPALLSRSAKATPLAGAVCLECRASNTTRQFDRINELPQYLIVNVNRSMSSTGAMNGEKGNSKNKIEVPIPTGNISLEKVCKGSMDGGKDYTVRGAIVNEGESMTTGHYVAICKGDDGRWREFSDESVKELTTAEVASRYSHVTTLILEKLE